MPNQYDRGWRQIQEERRIVKRNWRLIVILVLVLIIAFLLLNLFYQLSFKGG